MSASVLLASAVSAAVVLSGPFVGEINSAVQGAFPGQHLRIVAAVVAAPALVGLAAAVARIRERRLLRYGALAVALLTAIAYVAVMQPIATERFHLTEYAVITFLFYQAWRPRNDSTVFVLPILAALVVGLADEWFQWFVPSRVGELRDVGLNGVGILAGVLFGLGLNPPSAVQSVACHRSRRALAVAASVLITVSAVFLQSVHLGYEIVDPVVGTFRSRFDASTLLNLSAERNRRWQTTPPGTMPRISREDHYLSEGMFHVQRRDEAVSEKDLRAAWQENLILEKFYAPILQVAFPAVRWPAEQRAAVETAVAASLGPSVPASPPGAAYVSDAFPFPIYAWHRGWFWGGVAGLLVVIASLAGARDRRVPQAASV